MAGFSRWTTALRVTTLLSGGVGLIAVGLAAMILALATGASIEPFIVGVGAWAVAGYNGIFHLHITRDELRVLPVAAAASVASATLVALTQWAILRSASDVSALIIDAAVLGIALAVGSVTARWLMSILWKRGEFRSSVIVAGTGRITTELTVELSHRPELGIDVVSHIGIDQSRESKVAADIASALVEYQPDRLVIGETNASDAELLPVLRLAGRLGTRVYVLPRLFDMGLGNPLFSPDRLRGFPLLRVNRSAHPGLARVAKRCVDVALSATTLLALAPLLIAVALAVKVTSPGPVLFWQERVGRDGQPISIPKFRSMRPSDSSDFEWTADDRITPIGRFLRRSAIDEIPQLLSVLRGDMSLVGPRPERPAFVTEFAAEVDGYEERHRMRSGLTGLSQIAGLRGDTSIRERAKFDNLYIDQWSLFGDFVIMARTVTALIWERSTVEAQIELEGALAHLDLFEEPETVDVKPTEPIALDLNPEIKAIAS